MDELKLSQRGGFCFIDPALRLPCPGVVLAWPFLACSGLCSPARPRASKGARSMPIHQVVSLSSSFVFVYIRGLGWQAAALEAVWQLGGVENVAARPVSPSSPIPTGGGTGIETPSLSGFSRSG